MKAGVSYSDWARMTPFQRADFVARHTVEMSELGKKLGEVNSFSELVGVVASKLMGFI